MLKLPGCLILGAACIFAGFMKRGELMWRNRLLEDLESSFLKLENEIAATFVPLPVAMENAGEGMAESFFQSAARLIYEMGPVAGVKEAVSRCNFKKEENAVLLSFANGLSAPDTSGQLKNIKLCRGRLELLNKKMSEKNGEKGNLYVKMGVMSALMVVILFI